MTDHPSPDPVHVKGRGIMPGRFTVAEVADRLRALEVAGMGEAQLVAQVGPDGLAVRAVGPVLSSAVLTNYPLDELDRPPMILAAGEGPDPCPANEGGDHFPGCGCGW